MTDDIVTRLIYCTDYDCDLLGDAAREIQRLRKLVDVYMDLYASEIVRKAVRGE
jgi:hypothetical protein